MRILGIGTNIVEVLRIARMIEYHGETFLNRVFTEREVEFCSQRRQTNQHFASHWAAKEAVLQCLGTNWASGIDWREVEIRAAQSRATVALGGRARDLCQQLRVRHILLSLSHCHTHATAYALAVSEEADDLLLPEDFDDDLIDDEDEDEI